MQVKVCRDCKQEKALPEFGKYKNSPDGHWSYCKVCCKIRQRESRDRIKKRNQGRDPYAPEDGVIRQKRCLDCKQTLPVTEFHRSASEGDGLSYVCKECGKARTTAIRDRHRQSNLALAKSSGTKICTSCNQELPTRQFFRDRTSVDGLDYHCKKCCSSKNKERRAEFKASYTPRIDGTKTCGRCKIEKSVSAFTVLRSAPDGLKYSCRECERKAYWELRAEVMAHYCGGERPSCQCCGQTQPEFLTMDHINGDGGEHRKKHGNYPIFRWLKKEGYPEGMRVLCANCNTSLGHYGYCPHQKAHNEA